MRRRIAIFGGSFNPPTMGHVLTLAYLRGIGLADRYHVVPVFQHPFGKPLAPYSARVRMCDLAFGGSHNSVYVETWERAAIGRGLTLDLVRYVRQYVYTEADADILLVLGADVLRDLPRWEGWDELRGLVAPIFVGRTGYVPIIPEGVRFGGTRFLMDVPMPGVSSTEVRRRIAAGEDFSQLVHHTTAEIIAQQGIYPPRPAATEA